MWDALRSGFALGLGDSLLGSGAKFTISRLSDAGKDRIEDWELSLAKQTLSNPYAGFLGYLAGQIVGDLPAGVLRVGRVARKSIPDNVIEGKVIYHALPSPEVLPLAKILGNFSIQKAPDVLPLAVLDKDRILGIIKLPEKALPPPSPSDITPLTRFSGGETGIIPLGISRVFVSDKSAPRVKYGVPVELLRKNTPPKMYRSVEELPSSMFKEEKTKSAIPVFKKAIDFIKAHPVLSSALGLGGLGLATLGGYGLYQAYQDMKETEEMLEKIKKLQEKWDTAIPISQQATQPKSAVPNVDVEALARIMGDPRATMAFYSLATQMLSNYVKAQQEAEKKLAETRMKLLEKLMSSSPLSDLSKLTEIFTLEAIRKNPALAGYLTQRLIDATVDALELQNMLRNMAIQSLTGRAVP